jgi:hypothetical protein
VSALLLPLRSNPPPTTGYEHLPQAIDPTRPTTGLARQHRGPEDRRPGSLTGLRPVNHPQRRQPTIIKPLDQRQDSRTVQVLDGNIEHALKVLEPVFA